MAKLTVSVSALTLLFMFEFLHPARATGASNAESSSLHFKRVVDANGLFRTELATTRYQCSLPYSFTLKLFPAIHVGEPEYYRGIQAKLEQEDLVLFEAVRPPGFFGPPFEKVPELKNDSESLSRIRLQTLRHYLNRFSKAEGRPARTLMEALELRRAYLEKYLLDEMGVPFRTVMLGEEIEVCDSRACSKELPLLEEKAFFIDFLVMGYREGARKAGLVYQYDVMRLDLSSFKNADISTDILFSSQEWWEFRNQYAPRRLNEELAKRSLRKVAILYGVGHLREFDQILAKRNGCVPVLQEWHPVYRADEALKSLLTPDQWTTRSEMIKKDMSEKD